MLIVAIKKYDIQEHVQELFCSFHIIRDSPPESRLQDNVIGCVRWCANSPLDATYLLYPAGSVEFKWNTRIGYCIW